MGLLDGELAEIIGNAVVDAELTKSATLIRVTPGTRTPGALTAGNNATLSAFLVQAIPASTAALMFAGTLIRDVNRAIRIIGNTLPAGITPQPGDRITMDGVTSTIVNDDGGKRAVQTDPAGATHLCQCR